VPQAIFQNNVQDVVTAGYWKAPQICTGSFADLCTKYGVK
jgi:D-xylose transport system substrate-binding protein